jgi:hypothetical protein
METFKIRPVKNKFFSTAVIQIIMIAVLIYYNLNLSNNQSNFFLFYICIAGILYISYSLLFVWVHYLRKTPVIEISDNSIRLLGSIRIKTIPWTKIKSCKVESIYGVDYFVVETLNSKNKIMISYFDKKPKEIESVIEKYS